MATSRAAALQSLVLDESLRQYQSAAVSTVQNLASTFTNVAHALQREKAQSAQQSQAVQRQLAVLAATINEHAHMLEELRQEQATMYSRIADLLGRPASGARGGGAMNKGDLAARVETLERLLDVGAADSADDDEGSAAAARDPSVGSPTPGPRAEESGRATPSRPPSEAGWAARRDSRKGRASQSGPAGERMTTPSPGPEGGAGASPAGATRRARGDGSGSASSAVVVSGRGASSIVSRLESIEARQRQIEHFIKAQTGSQLESRLQMVLNEAEPAVLQSRVEATQRLDGLTRTVDRVDRSVTAFERRLDGFAAAVDELSAGMVSLSDTQGRERAALDERLTAALDHLDRTRGDVEARVRDTNELITKEIAEQAAVLGQLRHEVEGKADVRLVLDKVTKQEWTSQLLRLQQAAEARDARSVTREEYKSHINELRESIAADHATRQSNVARLANELHSLVQEVSGKASKADLVDVASVLHSFPKVHEELDHLRLFVDQEIASKQDLQQLHEATVTHRQLRRQMDRLLRALAEEVRGGENAGLLGGAASAGGGGGSARVGAGLGSQAGTCGTCLVKTSLPRGSACLSCAARLQVGRPANPGQGFSQFVPTKGGGFAVATPRRLEIKGTPDAPLALMGPPSSGAAAPPHAAAATAGGDPQRRALARPATVGAPLRVGLDGPAVDLSATDGAITAAVPGTLRRDVGTDGKVYTSAGKQTHMLVKRGSPT